MFSGGSQVLTAASLSAYGVSSIIAGTDTAVSASTGAVTIWNTSTLQTITNRGAITTNQLTLNNGLILGSTAQNPILMNGNYTASTPGFITANGTLIGTTSSVNIYAFNYQHSLAPVSTTTIANYYGQLFLPTLSNTATYGSMYGSFARIDMAAAATSGTVGSWYGFSSETPTRNAGADVRFTNHYGFRAADPSSITATNVVGFLSQIASGTNRYNIYASGTAANYFNGNVGIGTSSPGVKLDITGDLRSTGFRTAQVICNLGVALNSTTEIGNWNITNGAHNLKITVTASISGYSVSKSYLLTSQYNQGAGAWFTVNPLSNSGPFTDDFSLEVSQLTSILYLRLRKLTGATLGGNHQVTLINVGDPSDVFTPTTTTSTWTTATTAFPSTPIAVGPNVVGINTTTFQSGAALSVNGGVYVSGITTVTNATAASSTNTGALQVAGGVGVGGNLYVGGVLNTFNKNTDGIRIATNYVSGGNGTNDYGSLGFYGNLGGANDNKTGEIRSYNDGGFYGSLEFFVRTNGASAAGTDTTRLIKIGGQTNNVIVYSTVSSVSTTTGALQVVGGVGIGGTLYVGGLRGDATTSATTWGIYYNTATKELTTSTAAQAGASSGVTVRSTASNATYYPVFVSVNTSTPTALPEYSTSSFTINPSTGDVNIGGTVVGGGIRTTTTSTAPAAATAGDIWYNTTNDAIYRYTYDGVSSYWIDITGPTISSSSDSLSPFLLMGA